MIRHKKILILSDIEGSSNCRNYAATTLFGHTWPQACLGMTRDVSKVVESLLDNGVEQVIVKDFHRTGYNIFPSLIDHRARLVSGYRIRPVPGIGSTFGTTGLMMIGMHAPSGSKGFLAHTLTSRISALRVNGRLLSEAELFSAVLAPRSLVPLFFSGCPEACSHTSRTIKGITVFPIDKEKVTCNESMEDWRKDLAGQAIEALTAGRKVPYVLKGPFHAAITFKNGRDTARRISKRWGHKRCADTLFFSTDRIEKLYIELIKIAYLRPTTLKLLPGALFFYNLAGRLSLSWARSQTGHI